ncbi:MAG: mycothiol system anti-sigma-R factor [Actinomycetota bacterium]|nr:mycothiol system anti-sigma-R factor [Actinomycetota bacterium]
MTTDGEWTAADTLGHGHGSCQEALDTLYWYLDGELTDLRRQQIRTHLNECSPCLGAFDFEAELKVVVAMRCRDQVPEHLRRRVAAVLAEASGGALPLGDFGPSASGAGDEH